MYQKPPILGLVDPTGWETGNVLGASCREKKYECARERELPRD